MALAEYFSFSLSGFLVFPNSKPNQAKLLSEKKEKHRANRAPSKSGYNYYCLTDVRAV